MLTFSVSEKKKPKSKIEKTSDGPNSISDLLAEMTLQSASSENATIQPQTLLSTISNKSEPEVVVLDTPVNHKQPGRHTGDHSGPGDCPNTPLSAASPSVSVVIDALHLSDINWDGLSFTSSPPLQTATNCTAESKTIKTTEDDVKETECEQKDSTAAPDLCYSECTLRERVLMRNTARALSQIEPHNDEVSKQLNYELDYLNSNLSAQISIKDSHGSKLSGKESAVNKKEPLTDKVQCETHTTNQHLIPAVQAQSKTLDKCRDSRKPPQKYKFVRTAISSSSAQPQRCHSDPCQGDKDRSMPPTTKKSVCMSLCSSSDDSDAENKQRGPERRTKIKPINKLKGSFLSDFRLKPVTGPKTTKPTAHIVPFSGPKSHQQSVDVKINSLPASTNSRCQDVAPASVHANVFLQTPASPIIVSDSDDSSVCGESPLPLAERLRLKFQK